MRAIFLMLLLAIVVALSHKVGMDKGYAEGVKAIPPVPVVKTTDQQCVAWLFETNLKEAKKEDLQMIYQAPEMRPVVVKRKPKQSVNNPKFKIAQEHKLFDYLKDHLGLKSDAQLAERLNLFNSELSRIRNGILTFSPRVILAVYDATDMTIEEIRELL